MTSLDQLSILLTSLYENSESAFSLPKNPSEPPLTMLHATHLWKISRFEEAEELLHSLIENPDFELPAKWIYCLCVRDDPKRLYWKRYDTAVQYCEDIIKEIPEFIPAQVMLRYVKGYYSQIGQDAQILDFFAANPPRTKKFIDVGAFDGVHISNSRKLFELGWSGICIEPVNEAFQRLQNTYRGSSVRCIQCAVGEVETTTHIAVNDTGSKLTNSPISSDPTQKFETVQVRPLANIAQEEGVTDFDLLLIDAEDHDFEVIRSLNLKNLRPQLILVEKQGTAEENEAMAAYLNEHGYILWHDNVQDLFFRTKESKEPYNFWQDRSLLPVSHH